ncbi:MAG: tetratricopeptide repeat protein [Desulfobacterales bacterium]
MTESDPLATETMAAIYEKQGYLDKAAEVYRKLLKETPHRSDLADRLADIQLRLLREPRADLVERFSEWLELTLRLRDLENLARLKRR